MTTDDGKSGKFNRKEYRRKYRAAMSAEDRKRECEQKKKKYAAMSEEDKSAFLAKLRQRYAERQAGLSEEEKIRQRKKRQAYNRSHRAAMSEEEKEHIRERSRKWFAQLDEPHKEKIRAKKREYHRNMSKEQKARYKREYDPFLERLYKMNSTLNPEKLKANRHRVYLRMKADPVRWAKFLERQRCYRRNHRDLLKQKRKAKTQSKQMVQEIDFLHGLGVLS